MKSINNLPEFLEDLRIMIFSDTRHWSANVETKDGIQTYNFIALLHMPGHVDSFAPKETWTALQAHREKNKPGYRNFPWGKYQVFNDDTGEWLGEATDIKGIQEVSRTYLRNMYNAMGKKERTTA